MEHEKRGEFYTVRGYELKRQEESRLTPAMEDYLEMVYRLCRESGHTRMGKLAQALHVRPSSASKMVNKLSEKGYIAYDRYDVIQLTDKGKDAGSYFMDRHQTMERFLQLIGSGEDLSETELMEHVVGPKTVVAIRRLVDFFKSDHQAAGRFEAFYKEAQKQTKA